MTICPKCKTQVQLDARFCENCGWDLSTPIPSSPVSSNPSPTESKEELSTESLKDRIAILSGPMRQMKAKWSTLKNIKTTNSQIKNKDSSKEDISPNPTLQKPTKTYKKIINMLLTIATGVGILAFWAWLLMRKTSSKMLKLLINMR